MKIKGWELLLLAGILVILCLWAFLPKETGNTALVTVNGEKVAELPLNENAVLPVDGYGEFSLTVVVEDGACYVVESTCPDLICQNHAPVSKAGEQIVCLPGRTVVTVTGDEGEVDAVAK